jgi:hypothetical protein
MEFQFDGFLAIRKGDVIKVTWAYPPPSDYGPRRVSRITNETAQAEGIISDESSYHLADPITGKVVLPFSQLSRIHEFNSVIKQINRKADDSPI